MSILILSAYPSGPVHDLPAIIGHPHVRATCPGRLRLTALTITRAAPR